MRPNHPLLDHLPCRAASRLPRNYRLPALLSASWTAIRRTGTATWTWGRDVRLATVEAAC